MATIQARKTRSGRTHYRALVRLRGFPTQSASFSRKTDAKIWAQQTESDLRAGRFTATRESVQHTLGQLIKRYEEEELAHRSKGVKKLKSLLRRWDLELGNLRLADVTPSRISAIRDRMRSEKSARGTKRSPASVNRHLGALSHAFSLAVREWGWLEHNPVRKVQRLKEPRGRVRFLSKEERTNLLRASQSSKDPRLYVLVLLGISTGARQGELMSLRWSDIDLQRGVAILHQTKNGERRALALTGKALEVLRVEMPSESHGFVFANATGTAAFPRKAWNKALEIAGIYDFRFHDLRHTAASYLAMSGATSAEIAEILGHKTLQMVKRYAHLAESHTHAVVARMNESFL